MSRCRPRLDSPPNAGRLAAVFDHNRYDLLSLAGLLWATERAAEGAWEGGSAGVGLIHARKGRRDDARVALEASLQEDLPRDLRVKALRQLSLAYKAGGDWQRALELWAEFRRIGPHSDPFAVEEGARVLEHRLEDPLSALGIVEEALASRLWAAGDRGSPERRRARLRGKVGETARGAGPR